MSVCFNWKRFNPMDFNQNEKTEESLYTISGAKDWFYTCGSLIHFIIYQLMPQIIKMSTILDSDCKQKNPKIFLMQTTTEIVIQLKPPKEFSRTGAFIYKLFNSYLQNNTNPGVCLAFIHETTLNIFPVFISLLDIPALIHMHAKLKRFDEYVITNEFKNINRSVLDLISIVTTLQEKKTKQYRILINPLYKKRDDINQISIVEHRTKYETKKIDRNNNNNNIEIDPGCEIEKYEEKDILLQFRIINTTEALFLQNLNLLLPSSREYIILDQQKVITDPTRPGYISAFVHYLEKFSVNNNYNYVVLMVEQSPSVICAFLNHGFVFNTNDLDVNEQFKKAVINQNFEPNYAKSCTYNFGTDENPPYTFDYYSSISNVIEKYNKVVLVSRVGRHNLCSINRYTEIHKKKKKGKKAFDPIIKDIHHTEWQKVMLFYIVNPDLKPKKIYC